MFQRVENINLEHEVKTAGRAPFREGKDLQRMQESQTEKE